MNLRVVCDCSTAAEWDAGTFEEIKALAAEAGWDIYVPRCPQHAKYFPDAASAMDAPFEPVVPCRRMSTRPCVDLNLEATDWRDATHFRRAECPPAGCTRYESPDPHAT